jgi:hypothetical protein
MADKKPLRLSDDTNDLQTVEFAAADTVGLNDGGTGQITANAAFNALAPSQTGNSGKILGTDGTNTSWVPISVNEYSYSIKFGNNGSVSAGRYLDQQHNIPSNEVPFRPPKDTTLKAFTVRFKNNETITYSILKNAVEIDTLVLTAANNGKKINLSYSVLSTDDISIKVLSGSGTDPIFHTYYG